MTGFSSCCLLLATVESPFEGFSSETKEPSVLLESIMRILVAKLLPGIFDVIIKRLRHFEPKLSSIQKVSASLKSFINYAFPLKMSIIFIVEERPLGCSKRRL